MNMRLKTAAFGAGKSSESQMWRTFQWLCDSSFLHYYLVDCEIAGSNSGSIFTVLNSELPITATRMASTPLTLPPLCLRLEERGISDPEICLIKTRLLSITVSEDSDVNQSTDSTCELDTTRLLSDLRTLINRAFGSTYVPPYMPLMDRFSSEGEMISSIFKPGAYVWVLLRDAQDGEFTPFEPVATIGLVPYDHPQSPPYLASQLHLSWEVYLNLNHGGSVPAMK